MTDRGEGRRVRTRGGAQRSGADRAIQLPDDPRVASALAEAQRQHPDTPLAARIWDGDHAN